MDRLDYYKRRYNRAYSLCTQWFALQNSCYHYTVPQRNLYYYTNQTQGQQKNAIVYHSGPVLGLRNFVSKMQNLMTPPQQTWALLEAGHEIPDQYRDEVNQYLQTSTDTIFDYLRHSNFDLAINECYYDLGIGTALLQVNEGDDESPLLFYSVPGAQMCFEESINGRVESSYRTWGEVKVSEIQIMWPRAKLPSWLLQNMADDPNLTVKSLIEGSVYCHGDSKPYKYVLWLDSEIILEEEDVSPHWIIFRWSKTNNEIFGRGPVMDALPDILSLNELYRLELTSANLRVCPPLMAFSDGVFNPWTFRLTSNTVIPISPNSGGNPPIIPLPAIGDLNLEQITEQGLMQRINDFLFANPLGPVDSPQKTATELALRQRNMAEQVGPNAIRLESEFLGPVMQRIVHILQNKGLLKKLTIDGKEVKIRYKSPLVIAQGKQDAMAYVEYNQVLQAVLGPDAAQIMTNPVEFPHWLGEKLGIDKNLLPDREKLKEFLQSQSEQQQQQQLALLQQAQGGQAPQ